MEPVTLALVGLAAYKLLHKAPPAAPAAPAPPASIPVATTVMSPALATPALTQTEASKGVDTQSPLPSVKSPQVLPPPNLIGHNVTAPTQSGMASLSAVRDNLQQSMGHSSGQVLAHWRDYNDPRRQIPGDLRRTWDRWYNSHPAEELPRGVVQAARAVRSYGR